MSGMANWKAKIELDIKDLQKQLIDADEKIDKFANEDRKVKLDIDTKTLESAIQKLDKMLDSLGKGTGDFKQFENLSKELSSIVSEVQSLSKAFGKVDDSGTKTLLSSIQNIDKSLSELSQNILNVNKNMSNMGGNTSGTVKEIENISNAYQDAAKEAEKLADAQSKIEQKTNISSDISSQVKVSDSITDQIVANEKKKQEAYKATTETVMYHAGVISKLNKAETNGRFYGSDRGTGYFGTGHYFVDSNTKHELDNNSSYSSLPYTSIDISKYDNLFKATSDEVADALHTFLKNLTKFTQGSDSFEVSELFSQFQKVFGETTMDMQEFDAKLSQLKAYMQSSNMSDRGDSVSTQFMKSLGYGGVDTRGTKYADTRYGTVIYDLKEESVLQANITDELQKQGQMLEKINYEKGQVFDKSEDTRIQGILDQQAKTKEIETEFNKIFDSTNMNAYESELDSVNQKLTENESIINNCKSAIETADEDAKRFAKEMAEFDLHMSDEEIAETANKNKVEYQERIEELSKEQSLLKDRKQEIESNLDAEYKLANAARERATATVEDRMKDAFPDKDISASVESATNSIKEENNVLEQNTQKVKENTQAKEQNTNVNFSKYDKRLDSYNGKIDKYKTTIDRFNDGGWTSDAYLENVQAVKNAVHEYETLLNELKGKDASLVTSEDISKLDNYEKKIKDTIATVTNMSAAEKGYNFVSGQKELDKIHKLLAENSKMSSEAKAKIKAYYAEIESGNPSMSLDKIHGEILKIYNAEVEAGRAGRTLWDTLKNSGFHQIAAQMAGMVGVYDVINLGKEGFNVVRELNTALTEMRKVSDESIQTLKDYQKESFNTADAIATTGLQMQNSIADWQRLGYSINEANELAKNSNIYKNVGDMDISTATEHMVSSVQAWKSEFNGDAVKTSEEVMNRYNKIGNEFAISSADIGEAMETSAAALKAGGNDLNEALGIITAGNIIQQDASTTSSAMKILSLRIRGAKADLESMGESTDDLADSTSKLREEIKGLTGVDIMADKDTFKSTAEIIKEIGAVWNQLSDVSQAATLEKLAGKNRASTVAGLIENYKTIDKVIEAASNADNSALDENQKIIESIDGRIQQLSNRVQEFWYNFVDDSVVKSAVSALTTIVEGGTKLIDTFGTIPTLLTAIGAGLSFKNVGRDKMYSLSFEYADNIHNLLWIQRFKVCYP